MVQVAGGSQPHGECDALWRQGPGSLTWAGGLSEGTGHLPPTSLGGHTRLSPALWGRLFMGAGGEGGVGRKMLSFFYHLQKQRWFQTENQE